MLILISVIAVITATTAVHSLHSLLPPTLLTLPQVGVKFVKNKLADHLIEPVTELGRELFNTIRKREYVVTREELEDSKQSLHR
jgi:hypothetical protein